MAPFAAVGIDEDAPVTERGLRLLSEHLTRFFSYKGLRDYKDKFGPAWEPRYLVYRSEVSLPAIALALVRLTEPRHSG
jgi:phosphatidylglycerol lysyltransferase